MLYGRFVVNIALMNMLQRQALYTVLVKILTSGKTILNVKKLTEFLVVPT